MYKDKIDLMMLCGGSFADLEKQTTDALLYFDCINTFDNHKKMLPEYERLNQLAKSTKHRLIMACGWDPGIFSIMRALFYSISNVPPSVFWGKGISMGHSDAIRQVKHVNDGIEFTIPNQDSIKLAKKGKLTGDETLHFRQCYVVADKKYHSYIEKNIKNIPDYFKNQPTTISFVSNSEFLKLKSKMSHKGEIISKFSTFDGSNCFLNFKLQIDSNPSFTATIMSKYIDAIINLKLNNNTGAFNPMDIPIKYLFKADSYKNIIKKFC